MRGQEGVENPGAEAFDLHPKANTVLDEISRHPGIHKMALIRRTGYGWGTLGYHIYQLEKHGLIQSDRVGSRTLLRTFDYSRARMFQALIMQDQHVAGALGCVGVGEQFGAADLQARLMVSRKVARTMVAKLQAAGLVEPGRRRGRVKRLF